MAYFCAFQEQKLMGIHNLPGPILAICMAFISSSFARADAGSATVFLHQHHASAVIEGPRARLGRAMPITWMHIPKTGSSFANTLFHHTGICPTFPDEAIYLLNNQSKVLANIQERYPQYSTFFDDLDEFLGQHPSACPGILQEAEQEGQTHVYPSHHFGLGDVYGRVKGHLMGFFRQPEQRHLSGFYDRAQQWPYDKYHRDPKSPREYAEYFAGCQVKMLTRSGIKPCSISPENPTDEEVSLAITRVQEGFAFIGLTEEWELSMCLFHRMFGQDCDGADFVNIHPSGATPKERAAKAMAKVTTSEFDVSALHGFQDRFDRRLYSAANAVFQENLQKYDVTMENCKPCFRAIS